MKMIAGVFLLSWAFFAFLGSVLLAVYVGGWVCVVESVSEMLSEVRADSINWVLMGWLMCRLFILSSLCVWLATVVGVVTGVFLHKTIQTIIVGVYNDHDLDSVTGKNIFS